MVARTRPPTFVELFTPKLVTVLREHYRLLDLRADIIAGLTVAIVAIPLSLAIAIASGVAPDRGLYTSIVGGFVVSALGGSRFQIGGPAGAFIVLVAATVAQHGIDGLILATLMSGLIMLDRIGEHPKAYVIDFSAVPVLDSTAAATIIGFARRARRHGAAVYLAAARPAIRRILLTHGMRQPGVRFKANVADAVAAARREVAGIPRLEPVS